MYVRAFSRALTRLRSRLFMPFHWSIIGWAANAPGRTLGLQLMTTTQQLFSYYHSWAGGLDQYGLNCHFCSRHALHIRNDEITPAAEEAEPPARR